MISTTLIPIVILCFAVTAIRSDCGPYIYRSYGDVTLYAVKTFNTSYPDAYKACDGQGSPFIPETVEDNHEILSDFKGALIPVGGYLFPWYPKHYDPVLGKFFWLDKQDRDAFDMSVYPNTYKEMDFEVCFYSSYLPTTPTKSYLQMTNCKPQQSSFYVICKLKKEEEEEEEEEENDDHSDEDDDDNEVD